jgi:GT2 family glycosyltransferase
MLAKVKKNKISFIIVNYNSSKYIEQLIISLNKFVNNSSNEIIIIDNNSTDQKIINVPLKTPIINIYYLKNNLGFSVANNIGVTKANSDYIVLVNPDIVLIEDCITPIIEFLEKNENIGACGPLLMNNDFSVQPSTGFKMGLFYEAAEAYYLINIIRKLFYLKIIKNKSSNIPIKVAWISAALIVIKNKVFKEVDGFDTNYFLNYEDIDLCRRLNDKGYINYYFPYLKCIHYSHSSFENNYDLLILSRYKSRLLYASKHYNRITRFIVRKIHISGLLLRLILVNLIYQGNEKYQRYSGYKKALQLYIKFK